MCDINTTPLIDVMLVLLVTLIMSLPVRRMRSSSICRCRRPISRRRRKYRKSLTSISISDDSIFYNGNKVSLDDLPGYFQQEAVKVPQPEIHLRPEKRSHYDTTAKVLAAAQRNGMTKIGFVNTTEFAQ